MNIPHELPQFLYETSTWQDLRTNRASYAEAFFHHLVEIAEPAQVAFNDLMSSFDGLPIGIECRHISRNAWAFVSLDMIETGQWRCTYFDETSFSGHMCYATMESAVEEMIQSGYRIIDTGALDRRASTVEWQRGLL
ncbi:hypothetical protein [Burkholderia sp. MBR-1]|uniref:hypothetical protein n=1 Tax=Burkholderia sp. MBR-1 TaxID=2732364 RepID=UPI0015EED60B|nr:hypothetical protein [Burkholderia sp. MBR-1]QMI49936.1 hypothetical protein MBR110_31250 [Burkholderia sp. MBR-1]